MVAGLPKEKQEFNLSLCQKCSVKETCLISQCLQTNEEYLEQLRVIEVQTGEILYLEEALSISGLYILCQGRISLTRRTRNKSKKWVVRLLYPGDFIGVESFFTDRYYDSATALQETRAIFLSHTLLERVIKRSPQIALGLMKEISKLCEVYVNRIVEMSGASLNERFLSVLRSLGDGGQQVTFSQAELAPLLGVTRQTVNKHLRQLQHQGVIKLARRRITLLD